MYNNRCVDLDSDPSFRDEKTLITKLIKANDDLNKAKFIKDYKKMEPLAREVIEKCPNFTSVKILFVESLLHNCKIEEAIIFLRTKITSEEKLANLEFDYLMALGLYYDAK